MRLRPLPGLVLAALLTACATPGPESTPLPPPPAPLPITAAALEPLPPSPVAPAPLPSLPTLARVEPFPAAAFADLEPLPAPATDLWDRIVAGYSIANLEGPLVAKWEQWYAERPEYVARMVERSRRYLYHIVSEVTARNMPAEIALLPMIESAYNPNALSTSRASGIWQFMPSTGRYYGLTQNFWVDSRRDVLAATDKALVYLAKLHGDFNDWQLALAGYNWGEGNVRRAITKNQAIGAAADYDSLPMPDETRNYLPKLQAIKNIVRDPEKYGLALADVPDAPYFTVVKTTKRMDTKLAAELAEMPLADFLALNPQHNRPVIAGADEHSILLPIDRAEIFAAKLELTDQPLVSWQAYRTRPNETLPQVAARYGMSIETLQAVNGLSARAKVPVGHTLLVPSQLPSNEGVASLAQAVFTSVPSGRTFYYTVKRGDTLYRIAVRYGVTAGELRGWNGLTGETLAAGRRLRVTSDIVPVAQKGGKTKQAVATKGAVKHGNAAARPAASRGTANGKPEGTAKRPVPPTARANGNTGG